MSLQRCGHAWEKGEKKVKQKSSSTISLDGPFNLKRSTFGIGGATLIELEKGYFATCLLCCSVNPLRGEGKSE